MGSAFLSLSRDLTADCDGKGFDEGVVEICKVEGDGAFGNEGAEVMLMEFESG